MSLVDIQFIGSGDAFGSGGRMNTCFMVRAQSANFLIDCGATSLVAMRQQNVDPNLIDYIFISHLHGDHFAGLVFYLMDARYISHRENPLKIIGPKGIEKRVIDTINVMYPGCWDKENTFEIVFIELVHDTQPQFGPISVTPYHAKHLQDGNDFILRFEVDGKIITFSGDTGWTEDLVAASNHADLLITECFFYQETSAFHMDYGTIFANKERLDCKQIILTHLGPNALLHQNDMIFDVAFDGMTLSI